MIYLLFTTSIQTYTVMIDYWYKYVTNIFTRRLPFITKFIACFCLHSFILLYLRNAVPIIIKSGLKTIETSLFIWNFLVQKELRNMVF